MLFHNIKRRGSEWGCRVLRAGFVEKVTLSKSMETAGRACKQHAGKGRDADRPARAGVCLSVSPTCGQSRTFPGEKR